MARDLMRTGKRLVWDEVFLDRFFGAIGGYSPGGTHESIFCLVGVLNFFEKKYEKCCNLARCMI